MLVVCGSILLSLELCLCLCLIEWSHCPHYLRFIRSSKGGSVSPGQRRRPECSGQCKHPPTGYPEILIIYCVYVCVCVCVCVRVYVCIMCVYVCARVYVCVRERGIMYLVTRWHSGFCHNSSDYKNFQIVWIVFFVGACHLNLRLLFSHFSMYYVQYVCIFYFSLLQ
jgi:hypothetical protein